jgi:hypothetical protein
MVARADVIVIDLFLGAPGFIDAVRGKENCFLLPLIVT